MVDALHECWRVLRPDGQLIDARPIGVDRPVQVIVGHEVFTAGMLDVSGGRPDDVAANAAIDAVVAAGLLRLENERTFLFTNYWPSVAAARQHVTEVWSDFAAVDEETWDRARKMQGAWSGSRIQVAIPGPIHIATYRKT